MAGAAPGITVTTAAAAFVRGPTGMIVSWNRAAERLLRLPAGEVIQRPCFEVLAGRDVFDNRYCAEACPLWQCACRREAVRPFELEIRGADGRRIAVFVSIVALQGGGDRAPSLLHLLEPIPVTKHPRLLHPPRGLRQHGPQPGADRLTRREVEVLRLLGGGFGTNEMAAALGITRTTVRNHVQRCLGKLGAHSRLELVRIADHLGLNVSVCG